MAEEHKMIEPFVRDQVRVDDSRKIVSYGTSSYGYDIRVADEFKIFTNINSTIVDPKNFDEKSFVDFKGDVCIIPPNSFALARTVEYFPHPALRAHRVSRQVDVCALRGIILNVTPFEPEWEGLRDAGILEYDTFACENLRERGRARRSCSSRATKICGTSATRIAAASTRASTA